jgi:hypothetical protein
VHRTVAKVTTIVPLKMSTIEKMLEDVQRVLPAVPVANLKVPNEVAQSPRRHQKVESAFQESNEETDEVTKKRMQQLMYKQLLQEQIMEKRKAEEKREEVITKEIAKVEPVEESKIKKENIKEKSEVPEFITGSRRAAVANRTDVMHIIILRHTLKEWALFFLEMKNSY